MAMTAVIRKRKFGNILFAFLKEHAGVCPPCLNGTLDRRSEWRVAVILPETPCARAAGTKTVWEKSQILFLFLFFYLVHFILSSRRGRDLESTQVFLLLLIQNTERSLRWHVNSRMYCVRAGLLSNPECPELSWVRGTAGGISCARAIAATGCDDGESLALLLYDYNWTVLLFSLTPALID